MNNKNPNRYHSIPYFDTPNQNAVISPITTHLHRTNPVVIKTEKLHGANVSFLMEADEITIYKREDLADEKFYNIYHYFHKVEKKLKALKSKFFPNEKIQVYSEYIGNGIHGHTNIPYFGDEMEDGQPRREFVFFDILVYGETNKFVNKIDAFQMLKSEDVNLLIPPIISISDGKNAEMLTFTQSLFNPSVKAEGYVTCIEYPNNERAMQKYINPEFHHNKAFGVDKYIEELAKIEADFADTAKNMLAGITINRLEDRIAAFGEISYTHYSQIKNLVIDDILSEYHEKYRTKKMRHFLSQPVDKLIKAYLNDKSKRDKQ